MVAPRRVGLVTFERAGFKVVAQFGLVSIMEWMKVECAFAVKAYFSNSRSIIGTQRAFHTHFNIAPRGSVPGWQLIVSWVNNFRETGDVKKKNLGLSEQLVHPKTKTW